LPVVGAIVASVDEEKDQVPNKYPAPMPKIKMNMRYKPMPELTQADRFLYHIPRVYKDALNFNWEDKDCLLTSNDRKFVKAINSQIVDGHITIPGTVQSQAPVTVP